jgi:exonuclease VII large subunit
MARGYARVSLKHDTEGLSITDSSQLSENDEIRVDFALGAADARVMKLLSTGNEKKGWSDEGI